MKIFVILTSILFISCEMAEYEAKQRQKEMTADNNTCLSYGFSKGTNDYAQCRMLLDQDRKQRKAQASNAMGNLGKCLLGQGGYSTTPTTLGQALGNC